MIRYEANIDGTTEQAEPYTAFDEVEVFSEILANLGWEPTRIFAGRGGYNRFTIRVQGEEKKLHVYIKRLTFGGRESRPYEKRAQFSAALDRTGFDASESPNEFRLMLAIYKRKKFEETIICAWNINDWGYNVGRAFNCFIDIRTVAEALKTGFVPYKTSIGQLVYCFTPEKFAFYLAHKEELEQGIITHGDIRPNNVITKSALQEVPKYDDLFQLVVDILRFYEGTADVDRIEAKAVELLNLPEHLRAAIHNKSEGNRTKLGYQLAWARFYLKKAELIESPERSVWSLTELGSQTSQVDKDEIKILARRRDAALSFSDDFLRDEKGEFYKQIEKEIALDTPLVENSFDVEEERVYNNSHIENPFDPSRVDIKTKTMSLDLILKRLFRSEIDMETSFQRKAGLWNNTKQSRLIESILIKFPLPAFYFDGSEDDKWLVVDGLQRLSSLDSFVNKKTLNLQNLEFLDQFNGYSFDQLPGNLQRRIEEFEVTAYIMSPGTPKRLKYIVFERINTGGLTLSSQEIRNALNQGRPAEFVKALADLRSFKQATDFSIPEDRMLDREFATRFFAFYSIEDYKPDLNSFLNSGLELIPTKSQEELHFIKDQFDSAMGAALEIFGDDAFRKRYDIKDKRKPINKALFEVWSVLLSRLDSSELEILIKKKKNLREKFVHLLNDDEEFNWAITSGTGDRARVKKRFAEVDKIIRSTIA